MNAFQWSCLICFLIGSSASGQSPVEVSAVLGEEVTFPVRVTEVFETDKIICIFKRAIIAEMKFGFNYIVMDERFAGRLRAADESGSIKITNLSTEDSGLYTIEIFNRKKPTLKETNRYELEIFSRVKSYIIPMISSDSASGTCHITFNCTVNDNTKVSYSWSGEKVGPSMESVLRLSLTESASYQAVCCTVKNPVSNASDCVHPREHCFPDSGAAVACTGCACGYPVRIIACAAATAICALVGFIVYRLEQCKEQDQRGKQNS